MPFRTMRRMWKFTKCGARCRVTVGSDTPRLLFCGSARFCFLPSYISLSRYFLFRLLSSRASSYYPKWYTSRADKLEYCWPYISSANERGYTGCPVDFMSSFWGRFFSRSNFRNVSRTRNFQQLRELYAMLRMRRKYTTDNSNSTSQRLSLLYFFFRSKSRKLVTSQRLKIAFAVFVREILTRNVDRRYYYTWMLSRRKVRWVQWAVKQLRGCTTRPRRRPTRVLRPAHSESTRAGTP